MLAPVTLGLMSAEEASKKAEELLARVGLPDKADAYPDSLSGGQKQRIAIARAMLKNAPIVILDEATAFTDPENEALIQSSVAKLTKGKTLLVIAHRLSTITNSDRIFVVEDGNIRSSGTHQELLEKDSLYAQMWRSHIAVRDTEEGGAAQ